MFRGKNWWSILLFQFVLVLAKGQGVEEKIMVYNLLNYPGTTAVTRDPNYQKIVSSVNPDILTVVEMTSLSGVNQFLTNVMNTFGQTYSAAPFIDGPDSDGALFYKPSKYEFISQYTIPTALRNINVYNVRYLSTNDTLILFVVHLKASSGAANAALRATETQLIRDVTNTYPPDRNFMIMGDFNIYSGGEQAYINLLADNPGDDGNFIDPLTGLISTGTWNILANAPYHTQSLRIRAFEGGSTGGMDDRFDMILYSNGIKNPSGIYYKPGSYTCYGNDGLHFNDSINHLPNNAVTPAVAQSLHDASDHIPVFATFIFGHQMMLPIELMAFFGKNDAEGNLLQWEVNAETSIAKYEIQKSENAFTWSTIGEITIPDNIKSAHWYSYLDSIEKITAYLNYYRLKIVEMNGDITYSKIIKIDNTANHFALRVYPNVFHDELFIDFSAPLEQSISYYIIDMQGAIIMEGNFQNNGKYQLLLPDNLANEMYILRITSNQINEQFRIIKQ